MHVYSVTINAKLANLEIKLVKKKVCSSNKLTDYTVFIYN